MKTPKAVTWFGVYSALMALMYLLIAVASFAYSDYAGRIFLEERQAAYYGPFGVTLAVVSIACFIPFAIAPFMKPRPGVWVYDLVLISVGLSSCCFMPATIPLLVFWMKPETKDHFGRGRTTATARQKWR